MQRRTKKLTRKVLEQIRQAESQSLIYYATRQADLDVPDMLIQQYKL